jgi:hypothetical protein
MARCAHCDESIHYGGYWLGMLRNFGRNMVGRAKFVPIVTCGHCKQDNVQKTSYALMQIAVYVGAIALLFATGVGRDATRGQFFLYIFGPFLVIDGLWWTFFARLRRLED